MTKLGASGLGVKSNKSLRSKAPAIKDPSQSAKADSSLLTPAVLMALGMAGMAVAGVPESASGEPSVPENLAEPSLAPDESQASSQVAQAPAVSDLQMELADLIIEMQAQAGQVSGAALPVDIDALPAAMVPQDAVLMEQNAGAASAGAVDMEPIQLAQATVAEAAVPQAASAAADAGAGASAATAGAGAAGAASVSGVLLAVGALGLAAAAGSGGGSSSGTSAPTDSVKPTVSTVAITSATGSANSMLNAGDVVTVTVTMSEATIVTGTPQLALNIGGTSVNASYASGSGTTALLFKYTVLANQTDVDGISINADSLTLNSGTLNDAAGNSATLTHTAVADNASYMVDTTAPTITLLAASASAGTVTLTYSSALDASNAPAASNFTVTTGGAANAVTAVSVVGSVVTLTVSPFAAGSITVAYADPTAGDDANAIQDLAGNDAAGFASGVVADGYVRGATVYIDTNDDGTGDVLVGTTDASGNFFIPAGTPTGTIIATGGVNIDTGVANTVELKAPAGSTTINPLTTLVQAVVEASGGTAAQAAATVASSLGLTLSSGQSLLNYDPIAAASSTDATAASNAVAAQKAAAQVATIVALAESASANAGASVIANLATVLSTASDTSTTDGSTVVVNLADSTTITSMLGTALDSASAIVKAAAQSAIADASTAIGTSTSLATISSAQSQALDKTAPSAPTLSAAASTNDTTPTIRVTLNTTATDGTAVNANDVLTLKDNNVQIGSAVTLTAADIAAGYKDVTVANANALSEGTHSLSVVVTDQAGNASAASAVKSVNVDLTPPAAPTISAVASDNVINSAEQTSAVAGTAEAGATVSLSIGGNVRTATAGTGGVWTYTLSAADVTAMGQGSETLSATATDAAGNVSGAATSTPITVDTLAPTTTAAVTRAENNIGSPSTSVLTGATTNDNTLGLSGTVSAALASGDVVAVYDGSTRLGLAAVSGTTWTFDTPGLTNAAHSFKAQVEDAAGNAGAQGTAYAVTVNAAVPNATVSVSAAALTSDTTPSLSGTVTGTLATGDVVRVYDGTTLLGNAVVSGSNWTFTPGTALGEGAHSFTAVVQNTGGNQGTFSTAFATAIDATAPTAPVINAVATDNVVNATEQAAGVAVGGTAESGASVAVTWGAASHTVTAINGAWTTTFSNTEVAAGGSATISAVASDAAGNPSLAGTRAITVDTAAPSVTDVSVSAGDAINASELTAGVIVTGATDAGARVDITFTDTNPTTVRSVTAGSTGAWTYTLTKADISAMGQGSETFTVKATDAAGNTGAAASTTISIDTAAPTMSSFALTTGSDSGTKGDGKSNVAAPTIQLTAEAESTLSIDLGTGVGYQAAGTGTGASQTLTAGSAYTADGSYTIKVKSTDAAGNTTERSGIYVFDKTAPTAPVVSAVASDDIVNATEKGAGVAVIGTAEAGSSVVVTWGDASKTVTATAAGAWSTSFSSLPADGSTTISAVATDAAGNKSAAGTRSVTMDTASALPVISAVTQDSVVNATEKAAGVAVSGTAEAGASVLVTWGATSHTAIAGQGGAWTATFSSSEVPADASTTISAVASDAAGNVASSAATRSVTVDTSSALPVISAVATDNVVNATEKAAGVVVSGTAEAGASVLISWGNASHTVTATNGAWTATFTNTEVPADSSTVISAVASDTAGNAASSAATRTVTVDTVSAAPVVSAVSTDNTVNAAEKAAGVAVSGTAEAGASVAVTWGSASYTVTAGTDGAWTRSFSSTEVPSSSGTISAVASDTAGNAASIEGTRAVTIDTAAPAIAILSPLNGGLSLGLEANLVLTLNEAVATGRGSLDLYNKTGDALVETIDVGNDKKVTLSQDGTIVTINPTAVLVKGVEYYVKASAGAFTDTAGNAWAGISGTGTGADAWTFTGAGATVTIDKVADDNTVNLAESGSVITVTGTLGAEAEVLKAYTKANMTAVLHPATGADISLTGLDYVYTSGTTGAWTALIPAQLSGTADYTLTVSFKGTTGAADGINGDGVQVVRVDTSAPTLAITTPISGGYINNAEDESALTVAGTSAGADGQTVTLTVGAKSYTATAGTGGAWSVSIGSADLKAFAQDTVSLTANVSDAAGNAATQATASYVYDTAAPTVAITSPISGGYLNNAEDESALTVAGISAGADGQTVTLTVGAKSYTATAGTGGAWTVEVSSADLKALAAGTVSLTANVSDVAGNAATQATASYVYDAVAPTLAITAPISGGYINNAEDESALTIAGTSSGADGQTVTLNVGGKDYTATTATGGAWSAIVSAADLKALSAGTISLTANVNDAAGNSATQATASYVYDITAPTAPVISTVAGDDVINLSEAGSVITGTAEVGATVALTLGANNVHSVTVVASGASGNTGATGATGSSSATGTWSYTLVPADISAMAQGSETISATATDAAGNTSASAGSRAISIDTVAPAVTLDVPQTLTNGAATVTFNFSETVYGFTVEDISVANGEVSNFLASVGGTSYTALITPNSSTTTPLTPLDLTIDVDAGAASDASGNLNTAATQFAVSALIGTSGDDTLTVSAAKDLIYLGAGNDTIKLSSATGSTAALTDGVQGFGSGDKIDLSAILAGTANAIGYTELYEAPFFTIDSGSLTNSGKTVKFSLVLDSESYEGERIEGLSVNLGYDYANVSLMVVKSAVVKNSDGTSFLTDSTDATTTVATWAPILAAKATGVIQLPQNFIDFDAYELSQTETHLTNSGKAFDVTLTLKTAVTSFDVSFDSDFGSVNGVGVAGLTLPVAGQATSISASGASGAVRDHKLQVVSDTGTLGTIGDNQLHMLTTYDSKTDLTHLQIQYDSNSTYGTTVASDIIAIDFVGNVADLLTPASLTFI